jgi:predicted porin
MKTLGRLGLVVSLAGAAMAAPMASHAQSSVSIYGDIDEYLNYMHSSSGATIKSLEDGAWLRSRIGVRGTEDLGGGYYAKFNMEGGFSADQGTQADTTRFWDRQSWVGIGNGQLGEFRLGRQNGPILTHGAYIDFTARTLGSMINNFGVPSRYDNDISYISPRKIGVQIEGHVSLPESTTGGNRAIVWQSSIDWTNDVYRIGYMGLRGRAPGNAPIQKDVVYDNVYANWAYGKGTVYLAYVHSNNSTATAVSNNAGTILGNVGGTNAGTNPDLNNFYDIWQISADYVILPQLRIGALWGRIQDKSGRDRGANGGSIGGYYDLSKRTMLFALADTLRNDANGGYRAAGSAGLKTNFTAPGDINGRTINGVQIGIVSRF